jgi:hypothetical protein
MTIPIDVSEYKIIIVNHSGMGSIPIDIEGIVLELSFTSSISIRQHTQAKKLIAAGQVEKVIADPCMARKIKIKVRWENDTKSIFTPMDILIRSNIVLCNNIWGEEEGDEYLKHIIDDREYHELRPSTKRISYDSFLNSAVLSIDGDKDLLFGKGTVEAGFVSEPGLVEAAVESVEMNEVYDEEDDGEDEGLIADKARKLAKKHDRNTYSSRREPLYSYTWTGPNDYHRELSTAAYYYTTYSTNTTN